MKSHIIIFIILSLYLKLPAQECSFYLHIPNQDNAPKVVRNSYNQAIELNFNDEQLNRLFKKYRIHKFQKAFPTAVTKLLQETYLVECSNHELMDTLIIKHDYKFPIISEITKMLTYEPNDMGTNGGWTNENQTNFELIQLPDAWDITKGNENVILGITDTYFDINHSDLDDNIKQVDGSNSNYSSKHGTGTSGVMSCETDNNTGLSGVAFNCKIHASSVLYSDNEVLRLAQSGIRVINLSWINNCSYSLIQEAVYDEIRDVHNCVVVAGAGNTINHCGSKTAYVYPASYDNVVSVTSVGHMQPRGSSNVECWEDCHEYLAGDNTSTHHHNDKVNICAPGYRVPTLFPTSMGSYGLQWGTSFAAPHVAGVCGLMISVNPCLSADEIVDILYDTADNIDNIPENALYAGQLGAGRVNAYNAVLEAIEYGRINNTQSTFSGSQTIEAPTILSAMGRVTSGSNIKFKAPREVELKEGFQVDIGAEFEIEMGHTCDF